MSHPSSRRQRLRDRRDQRFERRRRWGGLASAAALMSITVIGMSGPSSGGVDELHPGLREDGAAVTDAAVTTTDGQVRPSGSISRLGTSRSFDIPIATVEEVDGDRSSDSVCIATPLPLGSYRQSSDFGTRTHPINGRETLHAGVDLAAPLGTPIHSVADGVVAYTGPGKAGRSSELVVIDHEVDGEEFSSWYVHMYPDGVFVEADDEVSAGEVIAEVGSNGNSTGPHLHLEIHPEPPVAQGHGMAVPPRAASASSAESPEPSPSSSESSSDDPSADPSDDPSDEPSEEPSEDDPSEEPSSDSGDPSEDPSSPESPETPETSADPEGETSEVSESGQTGQLDPASGGYVTDPLPYLRELGYGLTTPDACQS